MTDIASTDVTVTITKRQRIGDEIRVTGTIAMGDGSLTYPTGGVAMPAVSNFRLKKINRMNLTGGHDSGYLYRYDYTNNKITMWFTGAGTSAVFATLGNAAFAAVTLYFEAWGN
jgi:hypothetical protein